MYYIEIYCYKNCSTVKLYKTQKMAANTFKDRLKAVRSSRSRSRWPHFQRSINLLYVVYFQRSLKT